MKKWLQRGVLWALMAMLFCLGVRAAEDGGPETYQGPIVRNTTEAFPLSAAFSGSAPAWNDGAAFEDGVYEGYYAQLDGVSQPFYRRLQTLLADPAEAFTDDNAGTINVGSAASPYDLPAYAIYVPYPDGVAFSSVTASTKDAALAQLAAMLYRHILPALDALGRDHPELPWVSASWGISCNFAYYIASSDGQYTVSVVTDNAKYPFTLLLINPSSAVLAGCEDGTFQAAVDAAVRALDADYGLADGAATALDKVRAIHDFLCAQVIYAADGDAATAFDQNAYSALVSPYKTVCAGYTSSAKLLCDHYGIPCLDVTGVGDERHAWNYVRMDDGAWYAMDCTWDDTGTATRIYDFFLKGSATAVPYDWGSAGVVPFSQSHIETSTWSSYTVMPYPTLSEDDYVGYVLSDAPTAHAVYGDSYGDVALTGGAVTTKDGEAVTGGAWFAGEWTDKDRAGRAVSTADTEIPVYFSQNAAFDPSHIYDDPFDYPVTAAAALTVDKAPLTVRQAAVSDGAVTAVTFGGLKNGEQLTLGTDYTAEAAANGSEYDVTVTLLDTDAAQNYVLETAVFSTAENGASAYATCAAVSPASLSLTVGQSRRVTVTFTPSDALRPAVTWATSDGAVATVDETGLVTAVGAGSATITAAPDGLAARSVSVTVSATPTGLELSDTAVSLTLDKGETHQLSASILPAGAGGVVRWSSDLTSVATVSDDGLVTPVGAGFAVVTAALYASSSSAAAIATAQCMVSVFENNTPATGVTLNKSYLFINVGNTAQLTCTLRPTGVTDRTVYWASSDPGVAAVSSAGVVTAVSKGSAVITASSATPGVSAACDVTVLAPMTAVTLDVHTLELIVGDAAQLSAAVSPEDGSYPDVTWTTSDSTVATVDETGLVTAVGPGTAAITATAGGGSAQQSDSCAVTVAAEDFTVTVADLGFDPAVYGYTQPEARTLAIQSVGNRATAISGVTVSDPDAFLLSGSGGDIPAGGVFTGFTLRPAAGLGAGEHTAAVTVAYHDGDKATAQATFTVLKADADYGGDILSLTNAGAVSDTFTYGDVLRLTFLPRPAAATLMAAAEPDRAALFLGDTLLSGPVTADSEGKYVLTYDTAQGLVPLGDQTLTFRYGGSDDLNAGGTDLAIRLDPKALTAGMVALELPAEGYVYDGVAKTPAVTVMDGERVLGEGDYALSYRGNVNAGTASLTVTGRGWYTGEAEATFSIAPQSGKVLSLTTRRVSWYVTDPQSLELAPVVAGLVLASDAPVYGPVTVTAGGVYLQGEPAVDSGGLLTFALAGTVDAAGSVTLTVPVTGLGNYTAVEVAVTVPVAEDTEVTVDLSGLVLADRVYNGQALAFTGQAAGTCSDGAYSGDFTYTWQDGDGNDLPAAPAEAGTYRLLVQAASPGFRGQAYKAAAIAPAPVTVTAEDVQVYRGAPLPALTYTVSGLVDGDSFTDLSLSAPGTDRAGTWPITVSGGILTHENCYVVTYVPGVLTVLEPQVTAVQGPVWDGVQSTLVLTPAPAGNGTLVFAARYADGAMVELTQGALTGETVTFPADLTAPGWKIFFLTSGLFPLREPLEP